MGKEYKLEYRECLYRGEGVEGIVLFDPDFEGEAFMFSSVYEEEFL